METTPPLPSGFNINGYLIQSLKQTDPLCHVYFAADSSHVQYLVREFCPQGLAVRDPESGKTALSGKHRHRAGGDSAQKRF